MRLIMEFGDGHLNCVLKMSLQTYGATEDVEILIRGAGFIGVDALELVDPEGNPSSVLPTYSMTVESLVGLTSAIWSQGCMIWS